MLRLLALLMLPFAAACATTGAPADSVRAFASDRISVEVRGSGPDVVLIPGLSSHPSVWESTIAAVPDYRYHLVHVAGFAGKPAGANASGAVIVPVAEEIARYIRESRLERPAIVGHSMGGTWAMLVAARHPELASRVMVVDMVPFMGVMFGGPSATPESLRPVAEQMRRGFASATPEARRQQIVQMISGMVRTEGLRQGVIDASLASDPVVSGGAFSELIVTDLRPELSNIRVPLTVLWVHPPGAPFGPEQMEQYYRAAYASVPQAVIRRIPDSYHFIMFDQPAEFQRELREFLSTS